MAVELSIIIPARGNMQDLAACIESVVAQKTSVPYEVIVAYCNKDVGVHETVLQFSFVQAAVADEYLLPGPARNLGAAMAKADVLAFIDSDCILQENWIETAFHTIRSGVVLCSGVIKDTYPWNLIASSDNRLQYADFPPRRPYGPARYFPAVHIIVRHDAFKSVGGFGNSANAQDVLFTMEIARRWPSQTIFNPKMVARHAGRHTWNGLLKHHKTFGYARAIHQIQVGTFMSWISQHRWLGWLLFLRRFVYITFRVIQWNTTDLMRYLLQMPFIIAGLFAWTTGYYQGIQSKHIEENNEKSSFTRA